MRGLRHIVVTIILSLHLLGQSSEAVLSGTVTDPSGAMVTGAKLTAENESTGLKHETLTNEAGIYVFPALQPGRYQLYAEASGFRKFVYSDVDLQVGVRLQLNVALEIGSLAESVTVVAQTENLLGYSTASVGGMLSGQKILDLPIPARNALSLTYTQAGLVGSNFSGGRIAAVNVTLDGVNVQDQRNNTGVSSPVFTSVDRIEEFRVITSPADAEFGRGSGQVQMMTRSGSNEFHGSLFEFHRNTVLNANTWFNNQRGTDPKTGEPISPRNNLIRNQFGGRLGGPIWKNRTFFHFLYDAQRVRQRTAVTSIVYTEQARRGIYRFFPGVRNGNAEAAVPTVDLAGNPVRPAAATGDLVSESLYGKDPNRPGPDPSGTIDRLLSGTPLPNNFRTGDGLNTAGYSWQRSSSDDFDVFNIKIDHHFSANHRFAYTYSAEREFESNTRYPQAFPDSPGGTVKRSDRFHTLALLSTFRRSLLNELRIGVLRPDYRGTAPWEFEENAAFLPRAGSGSYIPVFALVSDVVVSDDDPVRSLAPLYQFVDNLSFVRGKHAFKTGIDIRFSSTSGFNSTEVMPRAFLGPGAVAVQNLERIPGIGQNVATARSMLTDLSGSLTSVVQALNATGGSAPAYVPGLYKDRHWKRPEVAVFFKDDYRLHPKLTLNLGLRWEYYGVPYDPNGRTAGLSGGSAGIFGLSGRDFSSMYQPGRMDGSPTLIDLIGPGTSNPGAKLYGEDFNNFAPAVGLSWNLPWGRRTTILRAAYGISYERQSLRLVDVVSGDQPGLRERVVFQSGDYLDLRNIVLPLQPLGAPLTTIPVTDRAQTVRAFDSGLRTPYVQNWNVTLQREIAPNMIVEARYVGSKGTKLIRSADVNERNIFENGLLDAFVVTQQGLHAPLLDQLFMGLSIPGLGVVNGTTITGSDAARTISLTQSSLALHNSATFAEYFNTNTAFTGSRGGLIRRAGLPENFVIANPQFSSARLTGNYANSSYHSLQLELTRRFAGGWTFQGNYTFSKALGEEDGAGEDLNRSYRSARDRGLDKKRLGFDYRHIARFSGTWELPFGPGKPILGGSRGWIAQLIGGWQMGGIVNLFSGMPITIVSGRASFNSFNPANTPATSTGAIDRNLGRTVKLGNGVVYFANLGQVQDPSVANLTTKNNIRASSTLQAITDPNGNVILVNPTPGSPGTMGLGFFEGPGAVRFDVNLLKRIAVTERIRLELRADAISALNRPNFSLPVTDINSVNFGRITATDDGNRIMVVSARINF